MASSSLTAPSTSGEGMSTEEASKDFTERDMGSLCESTSSRRAIHAGAWSEDSEWTVYRSSASRQGVIGLIFRGEEMVVNIWSKLDHNLHWNIIARLPFRSLFRAMSLSQAWRDNFLSEKFQSEVNSSAASWKYYFPLFVNRRGGHTVGYDSSSKLWHRLPTHSYPPQNVIPGPVQGERSLRAGHGSLLCWTSPIPPFEHFITVCVTNPLTKSWKRFPTRLDMDIQLLHVICKGREAYKVIFGSSTKRFNVKISLEMFDSSDNSWSQKSYVTRWNFARFSGSAVLNGVLHILFLGVGNIWQVVSFNLNEESWTEVPDIVYRPKNCRHFHAYQFSPIFVCGSDLMLVRVCRVIEVFRLDVARGSTVKVFKGLPKNLREKFPVADIYSVAGYGDLIYVGGRFPCCSSILYNVRTKEWQLISSPADCLLSFGDDLVQWSWTSVAYQPGLNPFLKL